MTSEELMIAGFCGGVGNCSQCSKSSCEEYLSKVLGARLYADRESFGLLGWLEEHGIGKHGGRCHLWGDSFLDEFDKLLDTPLPPADACIGYPYTHIITLDDSDSWEDHRIVRLKNTCSGKCLIVDDGFWGTLGSVYDPCTVSPPLLGPVGQARWNSIKQSCGCGAGPGTPQTPPVS